MSKTYSIKEIFYSLVGEGAHSGRPALFVRFSGCNLWSGQEEERSEAKCDFCDTNFNGTDGEYGGEYSLDELIYQINQIANEKFEASHEKYLWCTGGEPTLQMDDELTNALKKEGYKIAIETNGTMNLPAALDWVCVSPKAGTRIKIQSGDELKVVYPQSGLDPNRLTDYAFTHFYLQPKDEKAKDNTSVTTEYCLNNPQWKLSLQMHKHLQLP